MTTPLFERMREDFWAAVRRQEPPRDLEKPILRHLPLIISKIPRMCVVEVNAWLERRGLCFHLTSPNRPLRGCLLAYAGRGMVLLDGSDPEDEQRFSLAHEASHFLQDYLQPRQRAICRLGQDIMGVLDGLRTPTIVERVDSVLEGIPLGLYTHLLDRGPDGLPEMSNIQRSENWANRVALEMLAPEAEVKRVITSSMKLITFQETVKATTLALIQKFGLPPTVAERYGLSLCRVWLGGPSFQEWMGLK